MKKNLLKLAVVFILMSLIVCAFAVAVHAEEGEIPPCTETADGKHMPGRNVTCTTDAVCDLCGVVLVKALGHNPGPVATCANAQTCTTCGDEIMPRLEQNEENCLANIPAATCTDDRICKICSRVMNKALGHTEEGSLDCGHAVKCSTCKTITQNATGKHTLDWDNATVLRAATEDVPELLSVKCTTCQRTYERTRLESSSEGTADRNGYGTAVAPGDMAGGKFEVEILKVDDYKDTALAKKNRMLQTFRATLRDADGKVTLSEPAEMSIKVNKTLSEMKKGDVQLYAIKEDGSYEKVDIISMESGYITFKTTHLSQFAIVEKGGASALPIGLIIGIAAGAVVVIAAVVVVLSVVAKKKKAANASAEAPAEAPVEVAAEEPAEEAAEASVEASAPASSDTDSEAE